MFTIDLFLNDGFLGDNQQVLAIKTQLVEKYDSNINLLEYKDNDPTTPESLSKRVSKSNKHVFVISGSHGLQFIQSATIKKIIEEKQPLVIWVGHQDPGLEATNKLLNIVALPQYITADKPQLQSYFKENLVNMQAVPNTLKLDDLLLAKNTWNKDYPSESIPSADKGYIGVFLGGDAPKPDGSYLYWTEKEAYKQGYAFGLMAQKENKVLLITNGPRTGKFYPESPDNKKPVIRQYTEERWLSFEELSKTEHKDLNQNATPHTVTATTKSPLDPVSASFLKGVQTSGINSNQYQFFDFKLGVSGKPPKSVYKAMIAALYENKEDSVAIYSGESISYVEIATFIPTTYAFQIGSMNDGHQKALQHFKKLGLIRELNFEQSLNSQPIDTSTKQQALKSGSTQDADNIIKHLDAILQRETPNPTNLTYAFDRNSSDTQTQKKETQKNKKTVEINTMH